MWATGPTKRERDEQDRRENDAFSTGDQIVACLWAIALLFGVFAVVWWMSDRFVSP